MLRLTDVKKEYDSFLLDCSMEIVPGRITGLIGGNGAGKSTTFKAALGLISIDGGTVELFGKPLDKLTKKDRENLGVVFSDSGFSEYLRVKEIAAVLKGFYRTFDADDFAEKCSSLALPEEKPIKDFSTGMKAKLKVAAALSHHAKLLILDEPTAGLDVAARDYILEMLQEYMESHEDSGICISSHISTDLEKICDDLYMLHEGKIILHEEMDTLLENYGLIKTEHADLPMEAEYLLRKKKESYGYSFLTNQRPFFMENYPELAIEKGSVDDVILMMTKGERV